MIHPHTETRHTGTAVGLGVFATAPIPRGTIVYAMDRLEIVLPPDSPLRDKPPFAEAVWRYAYRSPRGRWIISWDHGKYVNHSCQANTLNTGYGFEIAVRDIPDGDEITDDYGMLNLPYEMRCLCGSPGCRGAVRPGDFTRYHARWEHIVQLALADVFHVEQPLWPLLNGKTKTDLQCYCRNGSRYRTVRQEQYVPQAGKRGRSLEQASSAAPAPAPVLGAGG